MNGTKTTQPHALPSPPLSPHRNQTIHIKLKERVHEAGEALENLHQKNSQATPSDHDCNELRVKADFRNVIAKVLAVYEGRKMDNPLLLLSKRPNLVRRIPMPCRAKVCRKEEGGHQEER